MIGAFENMNFILGTDITGQGIFAQIVYATPALFKMITAGAVFSTAVASIIGTVAGYKGGYWDHI